MSATCTLTRQHYEQVKHEKDSFLLCPFGIVRPSLINRNGQVMYSADWRSWREVTEADFPIEVTHD